LGDEPGGPTRLLWRAHQVPQSLPASAHEQRRHACSSQGAPWRRPSRGRANERSNRQRRPRWGRAGGSRTRRPSRPGPCRSSARPARRALSSKSRRRLRPGKGLDDLVSVVARAPTRCASIGEKPLLRRRLLNHDRHRARRSRADCRAHFSPGSQS
jgi:hypothetical protein